MNLEEGSRLRKRHRIILEGDVPSPDRQRTGCYFYERCAQRMDVCRDNIPRLVEVRPGHGTVVLTGDGAMLLRDVQLGGEPIACASDVLTSPKQTLA